MVQDPKKRPKIHPPGRILQLGAAALIAYVVYVDYRERTLTPSENAGPSSVTKIEGDKTGKGVRAQCGDEVVLKYAVGVPPGDENHRNLAFLGAEESLPVAVQREVIGMQSGGTRQLTVSRGDNVGTAQYKVTVKKIRPAVTPGAFEMKTFDEVQGRGLPARCGDKVTIRYRAFFPAGAAVFNAPLEATFALGGPDAPVDLGRGILGMKRGGRRWVILPPESLALPEHSTAGIALPATHILHVEVELEQVVHAR